MTDEQLTREASDMVQGIIERWDPVKQGPFEERVMRVLLNLAAFEMDFSNAICGKAPIRDDYPLPLEQLRNVMNKGKAFIQP